MTQDEIIDIADKADEEADKVLNMKGEYHPNWHQVRDEIFAKLVAAKEREACAKICGRLADEALVVGDEDAVMCFEEAEDLIRTRSKAILRGEA